MKYTRLELRLLPRGWVHGVLYSGAVGGKVRGVLVDPTTWIVTCTLVPRSRRRSPTLSQTRAIGDEQAPLPVGHVRLVAGATVHASAAVVGRVSGLWVDRASGMLTHALVRPRTGILSREAERIMPVELIETIAEDGLRLAKTAPPLRELPPFRADGAIARDVQVALGLAIPDIQARKAIRARVEDGHVSLVGNVETPETVEAAQRALEGIVGVRGVTLDLVSLETLADRVEQQIVRVIAEHHIAGAEVQVLTEHAIVHLEGHAPSMEARAQIEHAALSTPGARVVVNDIAVGGETPSRATQTGPLVRNR
jgi:osmotically-inducible protein OsmY